MKTHIIQLGENEDAVSLHDRMSWCKTRRILLVCPPDGLGISRLFDFVLLKRHAASMGAELAIVTQDAQVIFLARQSGVPVFASVYQANEQEWHMTPLQPLDRPPATRLSDIAQQRQALKDQHPRWYDQPAARYAWLAVCVLAIIILLVVILPGAQVVLSPRTQTQSGQYNLITTSSATEIDYSTFTLPTYMQEVTVEGSRVLSTTGSLVVPYEQASGSLEFTNHTSHEVSIPPGTIVSTEGADPARFITLSSAAVIVATGDTAIVGARAINPGLSGNLPADKLVVIPGDLTYALTVTNPEPMRGGSNASIPSPDDGDLQAVRDQLSTQLSKQALDQLHASLPGGDMVVPPTLAVTQVIEETFNPPIGEPGEQLEMHLKLKLQAQVVSGEALSRLFTPILNSSLPAGYVPVKDSLVVNPVQPASLIGTGKTHLTVSVTRRIKAVILHDLAAEAIKGTSVSHAAMQLFTYLPLGDQARISTTPGWWPWLPILTMRISVVEEVP